MENIQAEVLVAHAIDTEGPLYESVQAKFERLREIFSIDSVEPTLENYKKLCNGDIELGGIEEKVKKTLSGHLVRYNESWPAIDHMHEDLFSDSFRNQLPDSYGNGWKFTWHILDHVGFDYNPRRRDMGFHNIFDYYREKLSEKKSADDLEWHFHPFSTLAEAHRCGTFYFRNDLVYQILCRKIIERDWFPSSYRAGFQAERPDSNWFLEQWFPFDITNMACEDNSDLESMTDLRKGRSGNWRNAPNDWSIYHPHHDDYQKVGNSRRWIGRALNVLNRLASIDQAEVDKAFRNASEKNMPILMGITGHDFRDLRVEVEFVQSLIIKAVERFPNVKFRYCSVKEAFRRAIWHSDDPGSKLRLKVYIDKSPTDDVPNMLVKEENGKVFGPQPFLAMKTTGGRFIHDNFDFIDESTWGYAFHSDTVDLDSISNISVAANDMYGNTVVERVI